MKTKIKIEIERKNGITYFIFEVDKVIEEIFKAKAKEIKTSTSWIEKGEGLRFYSLPDMTTDENYKALLRRYNLLDDYGVSLYNNITSYFNIAFIRTVGGKGKIEVGNDIPFAVVSVGVKNIIAFLKEYYSEFLRDYKVRGKIDFEV